jgi:hypothetical protein
MERLMPGQLPTLTAPTTTAPTLERLEPGALPVVYDPAQYGYSNPVFAAAMNDYVQNKIAAMEAARLAEEERLKAMQGEGSILPVVIGAGVGLLAIKFLL